MQYSRPAMAFPLLLEASTSFPQQEGVEFTEGFPAFSAKIYSPLWNATAEEPLKLQITLTSHTEKQH